VEIFFLPLAIVNKALPVPKDAQISLVDKFLKLFGFLARHTRLSIHCAFIAHPESFFWLAPRKFFTSP
jgi:hypothetical protein